MFANTITFGLLAAFVSLLMSSFEAENALAVRWRRIFCVIVVGLLVVWAAAHV